MTSAADSSREQETDWSGLWAIFTIGAVALAFSLAAFYGGMSYEHRTQHSLDWNYIVRQLQEIDRGNQRERAACMKSQQRCQERTEAAALRLMKRAAQ